MEIGIEEYNKSVKAWNESVEIYNEVHADSHQIEKIPDDIRKRIKEKIDAKCALTSSSTAKGIALAEILSIMDDELMIGMAKELANAKKELQDYRSKYSDIEKLEDLYHQYRDLLDEQDALVKLTSSITDEPLRNAILAFHAMKSKDTIQAARDVAITYLTSIGRQDLTNVLDAQVKDN